ncbi:MAG: hypothetical protein AMS21_07825 [Gemmatimonas sp. SG8_38_2]|nr:MAG: hypothetical protein AMS21_07825 [Gemmatimonas sp. SG8_38_2]
MFFELTDLLTCPTCGPKHGLVLLVQEVEDRRVRTGWLGCPNCRNDYPVNDGVADLRLEASATPEVAARFIETDDDELALKVLALLGLNERRAFVLVDERIAHVASALSELAPELEVIAVSSTPVGPGNAGAVSRVLAERPFPLVEFKLPGVAIAPGGNPGLVAAAARRVATGGRLALFDATAEDIEEAKRSGLTILAVESGTAVAERKPDSLPIFS